MVSKNMGGGHASGGVMNELKMMGAMPVEQMKNMMGEMPTPVAGSTRLDTTGAANVRDLAKLKKGVVLTEEMNAEDVLGEESAAASEKVLNSDIYPEIHDLPENPVIASTRPKDYGAMMDSALAEPLPGMTNSNSAQSPISQAPVAQGPNLNALQNLLNPAAQMAPQVANQPEANHIPTMEYIPDMPAGNEGPAQMSGQYLAVPQQAQQPMMTPQMPEMTQPSMQQQPLAQPVQQMPQMQQPMQNNSAQNMTAGQLVQQNDPSAFRIPGM